MRSLLLFRFGPKARSTSWSIALCTMFIVASFAVADGLSASTENLAENFSSEYSIVTKKGSSGPQGFDPDELPQSCSCAFGMFVQASVLETQTSVVVFAISDPESVLREAFSAPESSVLAGQGQSYPGNLTLVAETTVEVSVSGRFSSTMFPSSWLLGGEGLLRQLSGLDDGFNFAIARQLSEGDLTALSAQGFESQPLIGIVEFLESGIDEIRADAMWVLLPSAFVIAVLAYSFIGSETSDRRHDIGIIKTVGAGRRRVLISLMLNAFLISAWGGLLGLALGVVVSYGTSTLASSLFSSVFIIKASELLLAYSFIVTVGAAAAGALLPALRMTLTKPVDDLKEAVSSS